jgi:hypothetical protein
MNLRGCVLRVFRYDAQVAALKRWARPYRPIHRRPDARELRMLRMRIEDKSPIAAVRWRGAPGEGAARAHLEGIAEAAGLGVQHGRTVPGVQPPGFLATGVESLARVVEGVLRAAW